MISFINSIINRANESTMLIQPRVRGKFERDTGDALAPFTRNEANTFHDDMLGQERQDNPIATGKQNPVIVASHTTESNEAIPPASFLNAEKKHSSESLLISEPPGKDHDGQQRVQRLSTDHKLVVQSFTSKKRESTKESNEINQFPSRNTQKLKTDDTGKESNVIKGHLKNDKMFSVSSLPLVHPQPLYPQPGSDTGADHKINHGQAPLKEHLLKRGSLLTDDFAPEKESIQTINVSIGRIEVRVSQPPAPDQFKSKKAPIPPMSLDEYLQKK
jgi:hypothetical protein